MDVLDRFSPATQAWFRGSFTEPTAAQAGAWEAISSGQDALVLAPTGSGKTLAAFLAALDRLARAPEPEPAARLRVLYVSPLKALAVDIERNLRAPIVSVSLGLPATFLFGGLERSIRPRRFPVFHGDVAVWGGPSRMAFHGIAPLKDGEHAATGRCRINLTFRRAR